MRKRSLLHVINLATITNAMTAHITLLTVTAASLLALSCTDRPSEPGAPDPQLIHYASEDPRLVRATLTVARGPNDERLSGVTDLGPGTTVRGDPTAMGAGKPARDEDGIIRMVEQAKLDESGRLVRLETTLGSTTGNVDVKVVLEPTRGQVSLTTASTHIDWSVPTDLPWIWVPILTTPDSRAPIATPLLGCIVARAATEGRAVRLVDLGALRSYPITADQVAVSEGQQTTVIVGNDTIDIEDGLPAAIHLSALGTTLAAIDLTTRSAGPLMAGSGP